jgi:Zinc carboxypeptidase
MKKLVVVLLVLGILLVAAAPAFATPVTKALSVDRPLASAVKYAPSQVIPGERATKPYPSYTYYSDILAILKDIDKQSSRMSFTQFATSAGGHPLYLVTIQKKWESKAVKQRWLDFIALQTTDPDKARSMLKKGGDLRAPVFINCSIHGGETTGVDAGLRLIRKLSLSNDSTTKKILANDVVMFNVCQNPDGRITDTRRNANGFDLNRDWITQSQPEIKAVAKQIVKWHPTMFLDLHGYYDPMIIDPTTNPHDPNYEWDLSIAYALPAAQAIEKAIEDNTIVEVDIPYRDWINPDTGKSEGFEDYSPYYTPQFAMFYGLVGSTMETSYKSEDGVDAHYYGILEGAKYTAANRVGMLTNQVKRFQRANNGNSQPVTADVPEPITYPFGYVIPVDPKMQQNPSEARKALRHLLANGVEVYKTTADIEMEAGRGASAFPAGSYFVPLKQPLRGMANAMLWYGEDVSPQATQMYDACAWQLPESWGFTRYELTDEVAVAAKQVTSVPYPAGQFAGDGPWFAVVADRDNDVKAVNHLVENGVPVERVVWTAGGDEDPPLGTFLVNATSKQARDFLAQTAADYGVTISEVQLVTDNVTMQHVYHEGYPSGSVTGPLKVAVYYDGPTAFALRKLGFDAEVVDADVDLGGYDVLVCDDYYGLDLDAVAAWVAGGGAYVANGPYGIIDGLLDVQPMGGYDWSFYWANNCLGLTEYSDSSLVTTGMGEAGYTFGFPITWFEGLGEGVVSDATYGDPYFLAGFWQIGDPTGLVIADAAGEPVVVHGMYGDGRVTFMGPMTAFRAHTEGSYRLLANAIYTGSWSDVR